MAQIELVYFRGCPHVESAREHLRQALQVLGADPNWREFDLDATDVPDRVRTLPSPTILVDGRDVEGPAEHAKGRSCRAGGAPEVAAIVRALRLLG